MAIDPHIQEGTSGWGYLNPLNWDLGLTEGAQAVGNAVNSLWNGNQAYANTSGGSELFVDPAEAQTQSGQVLGDTNYIRTSQTPGGSTYSGTLQTSTQTNTAPAPSGGINLKDPNANPGPGYFWDAADGWKPIGDSNTDIMSAVNDAYNATMNYANQAESTIRGYQPGIEESINRTAGDQEANTRTSYDRGGRVISSAEGSAQQREQNAISAARQALTESQLGAGQRFGRGSDIFKALGEYGTTKFQQTAGQARNVTQQVMGQLAEQKLQLEENFKNTMNQIGTWKQNAIAEAQRMFQDKLLEISSIREGAEADRSAMRIAEIQRLQQTMDQIKFMTYQYQLQAKANAESVGQNIASQTAQYQQLLSGNVNTADNRNAQQIAALPIYRMSATGGGNDRNVALVGSRTPRREDELV